MLQKVQHTYLYHLINLRYFDHTGVRKGGCLHFSIILKSSIPTLAREAFIFEGPKTKQKALGKFNKCTARTPHASHMANLLQHSSPQAAHQFSPAAVIAYSVFQKFVLKKKARFSFGPTRLQSCAFSSYRCAEGGIVCGYGMRWPLGSI